MEVREWKEGGALRDAWPVRGGRGGSGDGQAEWSLKGRGEGEENTSVGLYLQSDGRACACKRACVLACGNQADTCACAHARARACVCAHVRTRACVRACACA
eukprot:6204145-Pleurochrysis_carterae.AAC.12